MADNPFDKSKGGILVPGKIGIPNTTDKAKTTNLPVVQVATEERGKEIGLIEPGGDPLTYTATDKEKGLALTRMMAYQPDMEKATKSGATKAEILKEYGGLESNVPPNHPIYWSL